MIITCRMAFRPQMRRLEGEGKKIGPKARQLVQEITKKESKFRPQLPEDPGLAY